MKEQLVKQIMDRLRKADSTMATVRFEKALYTYDENALKLLALEDVLI